VFLVEQLKGVRDLKLSDVNLSFFNLNETFLSKFLTIFMIFFRVLFNFWVQTLLVITYTFFRIKGYNPSYFNKKGVDSLEVGLDSWFYKNIFNLGFLVVSRFELNTLGGFKVKFNPLNVLVYSKKKIFFFNKINFIQSTVIKVVDWFFFKNFYQNYKYIYKYSFAYRLSYFLKQVH